MSYSRPFIVILGVIGLLTARAADTAAQALSPAILKTFSFRSIGPTRASGRFVDVAVPLQQPTTIYMATGSGGLWKSVNNGTTWEPIFDNQPVISIGDVTVAPSNPDIVWVGTGEHTASRSTYWGDGVYKSTDAGRIWTNMGLGQTSHIGRIVIDPKQPDTVYVAALGKLYVENDERGVYKTVDGGKTWAKSLDVKIDGRAIGACDLVMDPKNSKVLYAATYDKVRKPWTFDLGGAGSAIFKTTDAGKTWTRLAGGLPTGAIGRIGIDVYARNPNILYANIENANKPGMSATDRLKELAESKSSDGIIGEEVYRSDDAGKTWKKVSPDKQKIGGNPGYYYMQIRIDPNDANHVYVLTVGVTHSTDGGKTWSTPFGFGGDNHAMWIDPANSNHIILGYDHGLGMTYDAGKTWHHPDNLPLAQIYAVSYDTQVPYNVYAGLQDNGSVRGPSTMRGGGPIPFEAWQSTGGGDGMYNVVDPTNRYLYNEMQFGFMQRTDLYTGEVKSIRHEDQSLRFQWSAPILISPHDGNTVYHAGNKLLKSASRGDEWIEISPDLTTNDPKKLTTGKGGDGNVQYCTITTIDESTLVRGLLYAGTDDGNVWVTKDGGKTWVKLNDKIPGKPNLWVTRVVASRHVPGVAYLTFGGYRADDFKPYVYKTADYGQTWVSLAAGLPDKAVNVFREDPVNPNLLFVGVDFGLYVSIDGGRTWADMHNNMPTQPVQDLQIHPRDHDLIVGTHGRGIFIADIAVLEELSEKVLATDVYLFDVESKVDWVVRRAHETAYANFDGPSEPNGILINYYLKNPVQGDVQVKVMKGTYVIAETKGPNNVGINQVLWNMRWTPMYLGPSTTQPRRGFGGFPQARPAFPTFGGTTEAQPGEYTIVVSAGGMVLTKKTQILEDVWFDKAY
jgi:photosystem II stability/assembly factor-like uncharacterized protein